MNMISYDLRQIDWEYLKNRYSGRSLLHAESSFATTVNACRGRLVYLATPYSKIVVDDDGRWDRAMSVNAGVEATEWAWYFAMAGISVISPIIQAVEILNYDRHAQQYLDPLDDVFWARWCQPMLSASAAVVIPAINGWDCSHGIWREACWALQHNVPVYLVAQGSEFEAAA